MVSIVKTQEVPSDYFLKDGFEENKLAHKSTWSWSGFAVKAAITMTAVNVLSHLGYRYFLSPSIATHQAETSPTHSFYNHFVTDCNSTTFKALQAFFKHFEDSAYLPRDLGFNLNEPPGDLLGFILDQNMEGLQCAYASYSANPISQGAMNKLLGKVLLQMQLYKKDLSPFVTWLVQKGANPNYQERIPTRSAQNFSESTLSPLMVAYRSQNLKLYQGLLRQGAQADQIVFSYSNETKGFDNKQPLLKALVEDIAMTVESAFDQRCDFYKKIVDQSIASLPEKNVFSATTRSDLEKIIYRVIAEKKCPESFKIVAEPNKEAPFEDKKEKGYFDGFFDTVKVTWKAAQKLADEFLKHWSSKGDGFYSRDSESEENKKITKEEAYKILNISGSSTKKEIKKACRDFALKNHPDKGGSEQFFRKVWSTACE